MSKRSAVGINNGNFRSGDYRRYALEAANTATKKSCTQCGEELNGRPLWMVGKYDICYSCFEQNKIRDEFVAANIEMFDMFRAAIAGAIVLPMDVPDTHAEPAAPVDEIDALAWKDEDKTVDVSKYFNGYKATASRTWAERHLNES